MGKIFCTNSTQKRVGAAILTSDKIGFQSNIPMFMATLFTVAKLWKQPKWPSMDEWISNMWSVHMMEYF